MCVLCVCKWCVRACGVRARVVCVCVCVCVCECTRECMWDCEGMCAILSMNEYATYLLQIFS